MKFQVLNIDEVDSTNNWLRTHEGEAGLVVTAEHQTAGRGCGTNVWESERGRNLLFSVLLCPEHIAAAQQFRISMATALAIRSVVAREVPGEPVSIKWPNDIYVGHRKICGTLIENQLSGSAIRRSIVGVGLNVNQQRFVSDAPNPVSLCQLTGHEHDRKALLDSILEQLDAYLTSEQTPCEYRRQLYRRGTVGRYRDAGGEFLAELITVEDDGRLLLRHASGQQRHYAFKELQFII